jgi:hypothetical protein
MFEIIDEPVEVNPETDSKRASTKDGIDSLIIYGRVPPRMSTSHEKTIVKIISLLPVKFLNFLFEIRRTEIPPDKKINEETKNGFNGS